VVISQKETNVDEQSTHVSSPHSIVLYCSSPPNKAVQDSHFLSLPFHFCCTLPQRWEQYRRPMPQRWVEHACELAVQLGASTGNLLVNYDLHYANVLMGKREPWLVVDPKVVIGDPEFGIAQLLWCRLEDIEVQGGLDRHFRILVEAAIVDPVRARSWTLVRCVDYWLWAVSVGLTHDPARCEAIVNWLL